MDPITITTDTIRSFCGYGVILGLLCLSVALFLQSARSAWTLLGVGLIVAGSSFAGRRGVNSYEEKQAKLEAVQTLPDDWRAFYDQYESLKNSESRHTLISRFMIESVLCANKKCSSYVCLKECLKVPHAKQTHAAHMKRFHAPIPAHNHDRFITHEPITPAQLDLMVDVVETWWSDNGHGLADKERNWLLKNASTYIKVPETEVHDILASLKYEDTKRVVVENLCSNKDFTLTITEYDAMLSLFEGRQKDEMNELLTPHTVLSYDYRFSPGTVIQSVKVALAGGTE